MPHLFAHAIGIATAALAVAGMGYYLASLLAVRIVLREWRRTRPACAAGTTISAAGTAIGDSPEPAHRPGVSVLKSLKGLDPGMMEAFRSHCRQQYTGQFELLFGVSAPEDPAADAVRALAAEFPERKIQLVLCPAPEQAPPSPAAPSHSAHRRSGTHTPRSATACATPTACATR